VSSTAMRATVGTVFLAGQHDSRMMTTCIVLMTMVRVLCMHASMGEVLGACHAQAMLQAPTVHCYCQDMRRCLCVPGAMDGRQFCMLN
jgi:hypothetical protein